MKLKEIAWHLSFWIGYLILRVVGIQLYEGDLWFRLRVELIEVPVKALALYAVIYWLVPRLLLRRQYLGFVSGFLALFFVIMWLNRIEDYYILYPLTESHYLLYNNGFYSWRSAFVNLIYVYPVVGIGSTLHFVRKWISNQWARERIAREKAEMELKMLKDQIHPHFLFNSMNNIYSLALSKSDKTPEMMLRLSKLLSYMVYDANEAFIHIEKEIAAMRDYVELERLRLGDRLKLNFNVSGLTERFRMAPLLLFPLLENCFKHGSHQTSEPIWINVSLHIEDDTLTVQIENSLPPVTNENRAGAQGVGLRNIKKRLELIYPGHVLRIHSGETYLVYVKINNYGEVSDRR